MVTEKQRPLLKELDNHVVPQWATMWRQLGVQLNVANHLLRIIEKNHPNDCEGCCSKMLQEWLDSNSNASWEVLTDILANFQLADNVTAGNLCL